MLKEYGNLLDEGIQITEDLLTFAKANGYKICLKTGAYNHSLEKLKRSFPYNKEIIDQIYRLYISGKLYPPDYFMIFGLSNSNMVIHILRGFYDMADYGVRKIYGERTLEKRRKTTENTYGVDNVSKSPDIKQKKIETCLKNHGVVNPILSPKIRRKADESIIQRFGVDNASKSPDIKLKKATLSIEKFGSPTPLTSIHFLQHHDIRVRPMSDIIRIKERYDKLYELETIYKDDPSDDNKETLYRFIVENYQGSSFYQHLDRLGFDMANPSGPERFMMSLLKDLNHEYEHNARSSHHVRNDNGYLIELDFYYPELKLGIEVNGLGTHSSNKAAKGNPKLKDYHFRKFLKFHSSGIKMISFTDYELHKFKDDVISIIKYHLNLSEVVTISKEFLEFNKIDSIEQSLNYGLFNESQLTANFENHQHQRFIEGWEYWDCGAIREPKEI